MALLVSGCDAIDLSELTQRDAMTRVRAEPPGEHCEFGGDAVLTGLDQDRDGELDDAEVTATEYVCDDAIPKVRTRSRAEPHGMNCALGGQAVESGLDRNANGQLDDAEVAIADFVCATSVSNVLLRVRPVAPGERCPQGGQVSHAGHDVNANGLLEEEEISQEVYACNEAAPVLSRVRALPAFAAPCDGDDGGGAAVEAGPDLDGDSALTTSEIAATDYACGLAAADLKLRQQAEPAGPNCPRGGTRVEAFEDRDDDGALDPAGFASTVYVCQATRVHDGSFVIADPADLVALEGVTHLRGTLTLSAPTLADASLPSLAVIQGSLTVKGNSSLRRLSLPALHFVGGDVAVRSNARLDALALGGASGAVLWVERSLFVEDNPMLPTLAGLAAVQPRDSIFLRANNAMVEPGPLPRVVVLQGSLVIKDNLRMDRTPFVNLARVHGDVRLTGNAGMPAPSGLEKLTRVDGTLELRENSALEVLHPLAGLGSVGELHLIGNPRLTDTSGFTRLSYAGRIFIQGNKDLVSAGNMPVLEQVTQDFNVRYNEKLQRVHRLPLLKSVSAVVAAGNPVLTSLEGFSQLTRLNTLESLGNAALMSLGDLTLLRELDFLSLQGNAALTGFGLPELARVSGAFVVVDNAKLPTCQATALLASVFQGDPVTGVNIGGNDDAATCP